MTTPKSQINSNDQTIEQRLSGFSEIDFAFRTDDLDAALALGWRMLEASERFAGQFALPDVGLPELPPVVGGEFDQSQLRAVAPFYLASELEAVRLIPAVETLAGLFISGGLRAQLGSAGSMIGRFWRARRDRFTKEERRAFFSQVFGANHGPVLAARGGRNEKFEILMIDFAEALYQFSQYAGYVGRTPPQTHLFLAAKKLAANLTRYGGGVVGFAARDILETVSKALDILKQPTVQRAVGAVSVWDAVRRINQRYLGETVEIANHVRRAKSGVTMLAWLAEHLPELGTGRSVDFSSENNVVSAATTWLQATLSMAEQAFAPQF